MHSLSVFLPTADDDDGEWEFIDIGVEPVLTDMEPPIDPTVKEKSDNRAGRKR